MSFSLTSFLSASLMVFRQSVRFRQSVLSCFYKIPKLIQCIYLSYPNSYLLTECLHTSSPSIPYCKISLIYIQSKILEHLNILYASSSQTFFLATPLKYKTNSRTMHCFTLITIGGNTENIFRYCYVSKCTYIISISHEIRSSIFLMVSQGSHAIFNYANH
jgi:hypothetical protein